MRQWKSIYKNRDKQLAKGFVRQFLTYATGAAPRFSETGAIEEIVKLSAKSDHGIRSLIRDSLSSDVFLRK